MNPKVDAYIDRDEQWGKETEKMRKIILDCGLTEELKWGQPTYTHNGTNVLIIQGFKEYCALMFLKGALLSDANDLLHKVGNAQASRQLRFTSAKEITQQKDIFKAYIYEALEIENAGLKVKMKETSDYEVPEEFQKLLDKKPALKKAFNALTPGRQRGYLLYFAGAKQAKTREQRIEKYIPMIMDGKGLNDQ